MHLRIITLKRETKRILETLYVIVTAFRRYFLDECEKNSRNYIEHFVINASESVINLATQADKLRTV